MPVKPANTFGSAFLFLRSLFWTILLPGTVTVYFPHQIVSGSNATVLQRWGSVQFLSFIPLLAGAAILLHCIGVLPSLAAARFLWLMRPGTLLYGGCIAM